MTMGCHVILSYSPQERSDEDLEFIYEELQNVRAFGHLSNAVSEAIIVEICNGGMVGLSLIWNRLKRRWLHVSSWSATPRLGSIVSVHPLWCTGDS